MTPPSKKIYGLSWEPYLAPIEIEKEMIRLGPSPSIGGKPVGNGLAFHYKALQSLLWPSKVWHRWNEYMLKEFVTHRTIAIMGPASSGKTYEAACFCLADWFVFPEQTTVLVCSTTKERLEDRVWGEIKALFVDAKANHPDLPGHMIEGRMRIVQSARNAFLEGRDFRNGVIGLPCFCSGTLVDTPTGKKPIESLRVGDEVFNARGIGRIIQRHTRRTDTVCRISLSDGRYIDCTPEHPIFTDRGWVDAIDLETFDMVFSVYETMQIMWGEYFAALPESEVLPSMQWPLASHKMFGVQTVFQAASHLHQQPVRRSILFEEMRQPLGFSKRASQEGRSKMPSLRGVNGGRPLPKTVLQCSLQRTTTVDAMRTMWQSVLLKNRISIETKDSVLRSILQAESDWPEEFSTPHPSNQGRTFSVEDVSSVGGSLSSQDRVKEVERECSLVSDRHCVSRDKARSRDPRWHSQNTGESNKGQKSNADTKLAWVVSVDILERTGDARFDERKGGYLVHNIEVTGHPSYSVNGVVVHNCKKGETYVGISDFIGIKNKRVRLIGDELSLLPGAFVDAISNLDKNPDLKAFGLGNPKDPLDALGRLAEPSAHMGGWDAGLDQTPGVKSWPTKRLDGVCIQLPGDDSPNLDGRLGIPLITKEQMDRDEAFYGRNSLWFSMFNLGQMPRGSGNRRVLTRQMCEKFGAFKEPKWRDQSRTKIAFLDAAYSGVGGDRCMFGILEFGYEAEPEVQADEVASAIIFQTPEKRIHRQIISIIATKLVPVNPTLPELPEDQIVNFVKAECEAAGIVPDNLYYDSGMRTRLVTAFGRIWSPMVNSIDFGGKPSDRAVSSDIQMLCKDYYSKFVTELWFNVSYAVQAAQVRNFTDEIVEEFSGREWGIVAGNKHEVETKEAMKKKFGRSPDIADAIACGFWGAIERGFSISKLRPKNQNRKREETWTPLRERAKKLWASGALTDS